MWHSPARRRLSSGRRKRKLARQVWQRLKRGPGPLIDLCARLRSEPRALFNKRERCVGFEIPRA